MDAGEGRGLADDQRRPKTPVRSSSTEYHQNQGHAQHYQLYRGGRPSPVTPAGEAAGGGGRGTGESMLALKKHVGEERGKEERLPTLHSSLVTNHLDMRAKFCT
jgi:hypothetical protein